MEKEERYAKWLDHFLWYHDKGMVSACKFWAPLLRDFRNKYKHYGCYWLKAYRTKFIEWKNS